MNDFIREHKNRLSAQGSKRYYYRNKATIIRKNKEKVTCQICDRQLRRDGLKDHRKANIHLEALLKIPPDQRPTPHPAPKPRSDYSLSSCSPSGLDVAFC